ncbi:CAP domain-containing protein [Puia dinghuensis]|uniref:SCP domain-containing protein n=1 Tax=Puia dinghuensis TaxID=1792502 RepID=A0A8J2UGJ2_9BACT|nr:CAP domain-containing protein [Puia dinghuensis]GGB13810.1 hypothetical protein GCM10011511_41930 [Puia dinghuensis]
MNKNIAGILLAGVLLPIGCSKNSKPVPQDLHLVMLDAVNALRRTGCQCGTVYMPPAPDLRWNDTLEKAAASHLLDMYNNGYFGHIAPDGSAPVQRAQALGYTGDYVGENIARGYQNVSDVMNALENSPDHCQAMMDTLYKEMGAARLNDYWDQEFGRKD